MAGKLATLCYICRDGKTLMLYRNKKTEDLHKGMYVAPGGKMEVVDRGKISNTASREVFEETGLQVKKHVLKGVLTFYNKDRKFSDQQDAKKWGKRWDVFVYVVTKTVGDAKVTGEEGDLVWVPNTDITGLPMHEGDRVFTPWIYSDKYFIANFHYLDKDLTGKEVEFYDEREAFEHHVIELFGDIL